MEIKASEEKMSNVFYVNADDFGYSARVNEAIVACFNKKIVNRTTVMVNMPSSESARFLAKENGFLDRVGLHITLTEGQPILETTRTSFLCDNTGYFTKEIRKRKYLFFLTPAQKQIVVSEVEAQIQRYVSDGYTLMHADSHQHVHTNPSVYFAIRPLLKKHGFKSVRISRNLFSSVGRSVLKELYKRLFNTIVKRDFNRKNCFMGAISEYEVAKNLVLKGGNVEIMVHPDYCNGTLVDKTNNMNIALENYTFI